MFTEKNIKALLVELRTFKKRSGMSNEGIAREVGVSWTTVFRWVHGSVAKPNMTCLAALDAFLAKHCRTDPVSKTV